MSTDKKEFRNILRRATTFHREGNQVAAKALYASLMNGQSDNGFAVTVRRT